MLLSLSNLGSIALLSSAAVLMPAACSGSGSAKIQDQSSGCIVVQGGDVSWKVSGGVLTVDGGAASVSASLSDSPACLECWITGTMTVHLDTNGNGSVDPGEEVLESEVKQAGTGVPGAEINLAGIQVNGVGSNTKVVVNYSFVDCFGNKASRTTKIG